MAEITADNASSSRLLARNAFLELVFDPGPGGGNVIVSALVQDPKFLKREKDPEPGAPEVVTQQATVKITVVSPSGVEVVSRDVSELPGRRSIRRPRDSPWRRRSKLAGGIASSGTPGRRRALPPRPW